MCIAFCQVEEMNFSQEEPEGQDDSFSHSASTCLGDLHQSMLECILLMGLAGKIFFGLWPLESGQNSNYVN